MGSLIDASSRVENKTWTANYADSFNKSVSNVTTQGDTGNTTLNIGTDNTAQWMKLAPLAIGALVLVLALKFIFKG